MINRITVRSPATLRHLLATPNPATFLKMKTFLTAIVAAAGLALGTNSAQAASLVLNGDFSSNGAAFTTDPGYLGGSNPTSIVNWTFNGSGTAGINGDGTPIDDPFGPADDTAASFYAFIQGNGQSLSQTLTLSTNTQYDVTFLASIRTGSAHAGAKGQVTIADNSTTYYDSGSTVWSNAAFQTVAGQFTTGSSFEGPVVITLANTSPSDGDYTVNFANVSVVGVPEPSSLALLGLGGLLLAGGFRFCRSHNASVSGA